MLHHAIRLKQPRISHDLNASTCLNFAFLVNAIHIRHPDAAQSHNLNHPTLRFVPSGNLT